MSQPLVDSWSVVRVKSGLYAIKRDLGTGVVEYLESDGCVRASSPTRNGLFQSKEAAADVLTRWMTPHTPYRSLKINSCRLEVSFVRECIQFSCVMSKNESGIIDVAVSSAGYNFAEVNFQMPLSFRFVSDAALQEIANLFIAEMRRRKDRSDADKLHRKIKDEPPQTDVT